MSIEEILTKEMVSKALKEANWEQVKVVYAERLEQERQTLLTELLEDLEKLDVSGGGSGRRFKEQFKAIIERKMK